MATTLLEHISRPVDLDSSIAMLEHALQVFRTLPRQVRSEWQKVIDTVIENDSLELLQAGRNQYERIILDWIRSMTGFVEFFSLNSAKLLNSRNLIKVLPTYRSFNGLCSAGGNLSMTYMKYWPEAFRCHWKS